MAMQNLFFHKLHIFILLLIALTVGCKEVAKERKFKKTAAEIKPLAKGLGACIATDKITVDGLPVGWMYREAPTNEPDSGWRFFSGTEDQEYVDNHENMTLYDINTIANYDPTIIPYLKNPIGAAFERIPGSNEFRPIADFDPD